MRRSQPVTTALKGLVTLWLLGVVAAMFLIVPEYQGLGNTGRIVMVHVPTAWLSMLAFTVAAWQSVQYLRRRRVEHDERALAATELGLLFATLATLTGSMFAKVVWGAWWNWEPRETSILILLLIYAAYFALRSAIDDAERRRQLAAVYALFAFVTAPLLIFVVPRLYDTTLHPNCAFLPGSKCDGITLAEGRVGDLGDNILELREIRREGELVTAVVAVRGTGGAAPVIMEPSYNLATRTQVATPAFEGSRFMLAIQEVSDQGVRLNIQAPGNTSQRNATTTLTLLASLLGFTGLFVWIYALRSTLLGLQRRIEAQGLR